MRYTSLSIIVAASFAASCSNVGLVCTEIG